MTGVQPTQDNYDQARLVGRLLEAARRHRHRWEDYLALYFAALEQTQNPMKAIRVANAAAASFHGAPVQMSATALTRESAFGYVTPPPGADPDTFAQCGSCRHFVDGRCLNFRETDRVRGDLGSCDYYVYGQAEPGGSFAGMTPEEAGYVERPVRCENCANLDGDHCELYEDLNRTQPQRFNLDIYVELKACCNAQAPKEKPGVYALSSLVVPDDDGLLDVPDVRQPNRYACGACAAMTCGMYYGAGPQKIEEWEKALGTTVEKSTHPQAIIDYLTALGLQVEARNGMTIADLAAYTERGWPVIVCVQDYGDRREPGADFLYGHYLTVIGVLMGRKHIDPYLAQLVDEFKQGRRP